MNAYTIHELPDGQYFADFEDGFISQVWRSKEALGLWARSHCLTMSGFASERKILEQLDAVSMYPCFFTRLDLIETEDDALQMPILVQIRKCVSPVRGVLCFVGDRVLPLPDHLHEWAIEQIEHQARREELLGLSRASAPRGVGLGPTSSPSTQSLGVR